MNKIFIPFFCLLNLNMISGLYAQDMMQNKIRFPEGISLGYGMGNFAVNDEYISKEKYAGSYPLFSLDWTNRHKKYIYQLGLSYRYSAVIKNQNVSTGIYQFSLNQGFLYSLMQFHLFNKNAYWFLGPSTDLFFYYNNQNIAVSGFDYANSYAVLLSLGLKSKIIYPVSTNLNIESAIDFNVLSFGIRMVDSEETNESPVKLLSLLTGLKGSFHIGARYYLSKRLSAGIGYYFTITRISAWDALRSASDNVVVGLTFKF